MNKTAVQFQMSTKVPEWIVIVIVVQMSITSEHLLDDSFDVVVEVLMKAGGFAYPIVTRELA